MDDDRADARVRTLRTAIAVLVVAYAWWAVARPPFSSSATLAVLIAGAGAVGLGARDRRGPDPGRTDQATKVARWALLAGALCAWELASYLQEPRDDHPTLSSLTNALLDSHAARAVAFVLWLAAARELARR